MTPLIASSNYRANLRDYVGYHDSGYLVLHAYIYIYIIYYNSNNNNNNNNDKNNYYHYYYHHFHYNNH